MLGEGAVFSDMVRNAPFREGRRGRGARAAGGRPGEAAEGGPAPARDADGNIIHLHESLPRG